MDSEEKSKSKSVSLPPPLWARVEEKASAKFGGNRSAYLRVLSERDLDGAAAPAGPAPDSIVTLARAFHPTLAPALERQLSAHPDKPRPVDQARTVARLLEALNRALDEPGFDPEGPFQLWSSERVLKNSLELNPELLKWVFQGRREEAPPAHEDAASPDIPNSPVSALLAEIRKHKEGTAKTSVASSTPARIRRAPQHPKD